MNIFRSFRFRIAGLAVLLSSAVLAVFGFSARSLTWRLGVEGIDQQLREEFRRHNVESRRPGRWERIDRNPQGPAGQQAGQTMMAVTVLNRADGQKLFQSSSWPRELLAERFPKPPMPEHRDEMDDRPQHPRDNHPDQRDPRRPGADGFEPPFDQRAQFGGPEGGPPGPPPPMAYGEFHTVAAKSGGWRVAAAGSERFIFIGAASLAPLEKNLAQLSYAMIAAAVPGILLIAAMGGFLAARALRPVSRLTQAAEQITARGLDRRMPATRESAEFQRLTDVFNSMLDRLDKSFQQATRFSADAAHELKTPLAILQGQLEQSLREASDSSPQQKLCADLLEEVQRLKTIIRKLLLLSLADAGELRLNLEPVNLAEIVENAAEDARILGPGLRVETDAREAVTVKADPDLLAQVVQNLVSNAIKYNSDGGFIRLELARTSTGVRLAVTNSGEPIASEHQPRLFDRFYRADSSRTRATEGVGLGLSLAREIARAHGGELALDRSDASGTTFVLTLPT